MSNSKCLYYFLKTDASSRWLTRLREARARLSTRSEGKTGGWRVRGKKITNVITIMSLQTIFARRAQTRKWKNDVLIRSETRFVHIVHLWVSGVVRILLVTTLNKIYSIISSVLRTAVELLRPLTFPNLTSLVLWHADLSWVSGCPENGEAAIEREILQRANISINWLVKVKNPLRDHPFFTPLWKSFSVCASVITTEFSFTIFFFLFN